MRAQDRAHSPTHNLEHTRGQSRGQALAADCPLHETLYRQPGNEWELKLFPVPRDGAANQNTQIWVLWDGVATGHTTRGAVPNC